MDAEEEALFEYADNGVYKKERTEYVDKNWTRAYMLVLATCAIGGIYAWFNKSLDFAKLKPDFLSNPDNCALSPHGRFLRDNDADIDFDVNEFWHVAKHWLCGTVLASIAVGVLVLYLFQKMAITLVWMSMAIVEVCFIVAAASVLSHEGNMAAFVGGVLTLQAVIWPWLVYRWRSRIVLCGQLLCVASKALSANPFLTPTVIGLSLAFVAAEVPLYGVWVLSLSNGSLIRTPGSIPDSSERNQFGCVDDKGNPALCCMWQPDNWLLAYWPLLLVAILWTWSVGSQLRAYIVSGCAAQWYFMNPSVSSMRAPSTTGFIPRALKHGLTTSFGSICFSGLVLPIVRALRSVIERSRTHSNSLVLLICSALLRCVLSIFLEVIEAITQFATVAMAITGQPFLDAGRSVTALLGRHLLSSVGVWIFPPVILGLTTFLLAALWGGIVYASSAMSWQSHPQGRLDAMALAAIAFGTSWMVLCFYKGVLLNIVDACYICFAMDLDNQVVTHQEVHDIYNALPTGKLVVQPDEELAYGSAADGTQQAAQAPSGSGLRSPLIPVRMDDPVPAPAHYPVRPPPKV